MAIIVKHLRTETLYVFLGASYSFFKDSRPSFFGGVLFPHEEEGEFQLAAVCDDTGQICWISVTDLEVVSVDGANPADILNTYKSTEIPKPDGNNREFSGYDTCPACEAAVGSTDKECPSCGLTLISME